MEIKTIIDSPARDTGSELIINVIFIDEQAGFKRAQEVHIPKSSDLETAKSILINARDTSTSSDNLIKLLQPGEIDLIPTPPIPPEPPTPEEQARLDYQTELINYRQLSKVALVGIDVQKEIQISNTYLIQNYLSSYKFYF